MKPRHAILAVGLVLAAVACKKTPNTPTSEVPPARLAMPTAESDAAPAKSNESADELELALEERYAGKPDEKEAVRKGMRELDARLDAETRSTEINRRTMIKPAPSNFKPENVARKIRLRLILEKETIQPGEDPRFRLEMTNIGREPIEYQESSPSVFVSDGGLLDTLTMRFYRTDAQGKRAELLPPAIPRAGIGAPKNSNFKIKLLPGETLRSIGDEKSFGNFKPLIAKRGFDKAGTYRLHVELDDRPRPLSKGYIQAALAYSTLEEIHSDHERWMRAALGPLASNAVTIEVTK